MKINVACVAGGIREWASGGGGAAIPRGLRPREISRAAKPRVKFPPATFSMVFACRPLLSLLMNQLNKPIKERSVTRNLVYFCLKRRKCIWLIGNEPLIYMEISDNSKHKTFCRQAYTFLKVKLRRLRRKMYEGKYDNRGKNLRTVLVNSSNTTGMASRYRMQGKETLSQ